MFKVSEKRLEKILEVLNEITIESLRGVLIAVEGKADVEALRRLGVDGELIAVKSEARSILNASDKIERKKKQEVILLMDFDRRGKEWTERLLQHLESTKVKVSICFWRELSGLVRREVKDVEGLPAYIETLKRKIGNRI